MNPNRCPRARLLVAARPWAKVKGRRESLVLLVRGHLSLRGGDDPEMEGKDERT